MVRRISKNASILIRKTFLSEKISTNKQPLVLHSDTNIMEYAIYDQILENRKKAFELEKLEHPERRTKNIRNWFVDNIVWLNPGKSELIQKEKYIRSS